MLNRYLVTIEDELGKKYRDLVDREEYRGLNRYTPRAIAEILDKVGGMDKFNTGEIEKSIVNVYGHLTGSVQRGIYELEHQTNALLRQKTDVGAFVRGENAYAIIKCSFKNSREKPRNVTDIKLAINILDSEFISPIHHYQESLKSLLKELVSEHVQILVEKEIEALNQSLIDEGKEELSSNEMIFEKLKALENYTDNEEEADNAKRYQFVAKRFLDAIDGFVFEISPEDYDPLAVRENVKRIIDNENIRNRGFNTVVNLLTATLDTSRMGYQHIENFKNSRKCVIREYEDTHQDNLPDERYKIIISYLDSEQLKEMCNAYDLQLAELEFEIDKTSKVVDKLYERDRTFMDYADVLKKRGVKTSASATSYFSADTKEEEELEEEGFEEEDTLWNEISFIQPEPTQVEEMNKTGQNAVTTNKKRITILKDKLAGVYQHDNHPQRLVVEQRISFLEEKFQAFAAKINPYHADPGLILEVDITSVKRKQTTMMGMSNVLNEVLSGLSKGFGDKAFAAFSRRRSTEKDDLEETFVAVSSTGAFEEEEKEDAMAD